jgi:hypothetical protein
LVVRPLIELCQSLADIVSCRTNNRIGTGIEAWFPVKYLYSEGALLDCLVVPGQGSLNHTPQKNSAPLAVLEGMVIQDTVEFLNDKRPLFKRQLSAGLSRRPWFCLLFAQYAIPWRFQSYP